MKHRYDLWFVVKRAEDLPDQWVAHCLDLDVVTQGGGAAHALRMLAEACVMTIMHAREAGDDPFAGQRAPEEYWNELYDMMERGERVAPADVLAKLELDPSFMAGSVQLTIEELSGAKPRETVRAAFRSRSEPVACPA